jgi:hypothetical protein
LHHKKLTSHHSIEDILRVIEKIHPINFWFIGLGLAVLFSVIWYSVGSAQSVGLSNDPTNLSFHVLDASPTGGSFDPNSFLNEYEIEREFQAKGHPTGLIDEQTLIPIPQTIEAGVPVDSVTLVNMTDTSQFQTPNDPKDDSIEYIPGIDFTGTDSFMYQICDATGDCDQAEVTVNVTSSSETQIALEVTTDILSTNLTPGTPTATNDNASADQNGWVNIDVLENDDFGSDGPSSSAITIYSPPSSGTATVIINEGARSPDPSGLAYLSNSDVLLISDGEVNELVPPNPAAYTGINLFITSLVGSLEATLTTYDPPGIEFSNEPTGVAFNPDKGFLYFTDDTGQRGIYELDPGDDGLFNTPDDAITFFGTVGTDPEGIAYDSIRKHLFVVDGFNREVYDIDLGSNGVLNPKDSVTQFDVGPGSTVNLDDPEGIEFNPDNNHLYILDRSGQKRIAETTIDGVLLRYLEISAINSNSPAGLALAPASEGGPGKNLYIVDRGEDNTPPGGDPLENDGKLYEVSFDVNVPPYVDAGANQSIIYGESANLDGTVFDDGIPDPPGAVTTAWSVMSIPSGASADILNPNSVDTTATNFSSPGNYLLRLTADDGGRINYDEITISVLPLSNQPPQVDAGPFQAITLGDDAILDGTVIDDGLGNPPGTLDTTWGVSSGPGLVTFVDASAEDTTASFSESGQYVLHLDAYDGEFLATDQITINVNPAQQKNIWLPLVSRKTTNH